ncbi:MAG: hypothetical protein ACOC93_00040 [Planctomycetota bacterium]
MTKTKQPATTTRDAKERTRPETTRDPVLRFTPTAWAKLLFFRDYQETEIGGFGVTAEDDPLLVEEFVTVKQDVTVASVAFDDEAVADFFDSQVDLGRQPEQFARLWLHTHPGNSTIPSTTDEETFCRAFGSCQWAVMFILARNGNCSARLRFNIGPGGQLAIPVRVDYSRPFGPSNQEAWATEYQAHITRQPDPRLAAAYFGDDEEPLAGCACPDDWIEELEEMEPEERELVLAELAARPDLWSESEGYDERD